MYAPKVVKQHSGNVCAGSRSALNQRVTQCVPWSNQILGTSNEVKTAPSLPSNLVFKTTPIKVHDYDFNAFVYQLPDIPHKNTMTELLTAIAAEMGGIKVPASNAFLKKNQLNAIGIHGGSDDPANFIASANHRNIYKQGIDPCVVRIGGTYGVQQTILVIDYQFGNDSYGYVTGISHNGERFTMYHETGQNALTNAQVALLKDGVVDSPLYSKYDSAHHTGGNELIANEIANIANIAQTNIDANLPHDTPPKLPEDAQFVTTNKDRLKERSRILDAVTKIAGEGARWQCVRENAALLKNGSKFYVRKNGNGNKRYFIDFQTLWGLWKSKFNCKFNIQDKKVAEVIRDNYRDPEHTCDAANLTANDFELKDNGESISFD